MESKPSISEFDTIQSRIKQLNSSYTAGLDHSYVIDDVPEDQLKEEGRRIAAVLRCPNSGRMFRMQTSEPILHAYSGNYLKGQKGRDGKTYAHQSGICLMPQRYPNAVNQPTFPSVIVKPGEKYVTSMVLYFQSPGDFGHNLRLKMNEERERAATQK